eukprot:756850-Pleurochrysis_carterae.AAC.1
MTQHISESFTEAHEKDWAHFFQNFPRTIEDVVETDETRFNKYDLPQCSLLLADGSALYITTRCACFAQGAPMICKH